MKRFLALVMACLLLFSGVALAELTDDYAKRLFEGNENEALYALFSEEVKAQMPFEAFAAIKDQLIAACGPLKEIGEAKTTPYGVQTVLMQLIAFEKQTLVMQKIADAQGRIIGLGFTPYEDPKESEPQEAVALPDGVVEKEITVGEGEWALPGLITLPENLSGVPAVVLVHGSGPNDRDETVGQTKFFRDLAYTLAQNGIAVIRYDKRTLVHGAKMDNAITIEEETIEDAILAGKRIAEMPEVDASRIFLLGHSLGGMQAPRIAKEADGLFCGMILAASTPKTLVDIMLAQNKAVIATLPEERQAPSLQMLEEELIRMEAIYALSADEMKKEILFTMPAYYLFEMQTIDPIETMLELQIPTLILQGEGDFQVTLENGIDAYKAGLSDAEYVVYKLYPGLNHCFTGSVETQSAEDYNQPLRVDETVISDIIDFIK